MDAIYHLMGVCPQHDLLWETLTGYEHLLFYGRLKGYKGEGGGGGGHTAAVGRAAEMQVLSQQPHHHVHPT
jgi:ABC-type multidrug transport system ATPase subunit